MASQLRPLKKPFRISWGNYIQNTTRSQFTKDFNHLNRHKQTAKFNKDVLRVQPSALREAIRPEDRIKWWNIVPGDRVRIAGDKTAAVHEVYSINKIANTVFLRGVKTRPDVQDLKPIPYSCLQLFVDHFELPPKPGQDKPEIVPVFARRLATSPPVWVKDKWIWTRYASATVPKLPRLPDEPKTRIEIAWPEPIPELNVPEASIYDTAEEAVREVTWQPPRTRLRPLRDVSIPDKYLAALHEPVPNEASESLPMEHFLAIELSNPHSRTKKQRRWQERLKGLVQLRKDVLTAELNNLDGRTRRDARSEAEYRFRVQIERAQKSEGMRRRILRGELAKVARRKIRKARKEARRIRNLRETKLHREENQVLPGAGEVVDKSVFLG